MADLFARGVVIDAILGFMIAEWLLLILVRKRRGSGPRPVESLVGLGAGAALLLALRAALRRESWPTMAAWLIVALCCHLQDLRWRWSRHHD